MQSSAPDVFGAPAGDLARIAVALRSVASRYSIGLGAASDVDAAAAAVAATMWCAATDIERFAEVPLGTPGAVAALSRILLRAAGQPVPAKAQCTAAEVPGEELLEVAEGCVASAVAAGHDPSQVAAHACADLVGECAELNAAAAALAAAAEHATAGR